MHYEPEVMGQALKFADVGVRGWAHSSMALSALGNLSTLSCVGVCNAEAKGDRTRSSSSRGEA